jgi:hypothetical protein
LSPPYGRASDGDPISLHWACNQDTASSRGLVAVDHALEGPFSVQLVQVCSWPSPAVAVSPPSIDAGERPPTRARQQTVSRERRPVLSKNSVSTFGWISVVGLAASGRARVHPSRRTKMIQVPSAPAGGIPAAIRSSNAADRSGVFAATLKAGLSTELACGKPSK